MAATLDGGMLVPVAKLRFLILAAGLAACGNQTAGQYPSGGGSIPVGGGVVGTGNVSEADAGVRDASLDTGVIDSGIDGAIIDGAIIDVNPSDASTLGQFPDARLPIDAPPGGHRVSGHVCALSSVLAARTCTPAIDTVLQIVTDGASANVAADGSFNLLLPAADVPGTSITLTTTGDPTYYPGAAEVTLAANGGAGINLQVMTVDYVAALQADNGQSGPTVLVVSLDQGSQPAAGASASAILGIPPCYDAGDPDVLSLDPPTQAAGMFMYFLPFGDGDDTVQITLADTTKTFHVTTVTGALTTARVSF